MHKAARNKRSKHKISEAVKSNVAMHPFVIVSILAALVLVVLTIIFYLFGSTW